MTSLASLSTAALRDAFVAAHEQGDTLTADACWAIFTSRQLHLDGTRRDPIVTYHAFQPFPVPVRDFDWQAHRDSDEGGEGLSGWGRTEAAAIADLVALEAERDEDAAVDAARLKVALLAGRDVAQPGSVDPAEIAAAQAVLRALLEDAADEAEAERAVAAAERAEYERDEAADAKRDAARDDADYWARSEAAEPEGKADDPFEG